MWNRTWSPPVLPNTLNDLPEALGHPQGFSVPPERDFSADFSWEHHSVSTEGPMSCSSLQGPPPSLSTCRFYGIKREFEIAEGGNLEQQPQPGLLGFEGMDWDQWLLQVGGGIHTLKG